jgi:hypothetical protein
MSKALVLIGGILTGIFLSAGVCVALALVADAVWRSDREDQDSALNLSYYKRGLGLYRSRDKKT